MTTFTYLELKKMTPRSGVKFATTYVKQHPKQREEMSKWILQRIEEIVDMVDCDYRLAEEIYTPLPDFKRTQKQPPRSLADIVKDLRDECVGTKKDGSPKDFAMAPIERWNKFFKGSQYEFRLEQGSAFAPPKTTFDNLF
jgi:hypothetical protein